MFFHIVRSLLLLSARLESGGGGGGGTAFPDSIPCLWTTAVPSLQRQMLSVLPLWFRLQSKQETHRLTNRAPAWTSQTCTTTVPLKCTTALSPGKWKVNLFVDARRAAVACIHLTRKTWDPRVCSVTRHFQKRTSTFTAQNQKQHMGALFWMHEWYYCQKKFWHGSPGARNNANPVLAGRRCLHRKQPEWEKKVSHSKTPKLWTKSQL